jgi:hypothetical protein
MAKKDESLSLFKTDQDMIDRIGAKAAMDAGIKSGKDAKANLKNSPAIQAQIKKRNAAQKQLDERKAKNNKKDEWVPIPQDPGIAKGKEKRRKEIEEAKKYQADQKAKKDAAKGGFGSGSAKTRGDKANVSKEQLDKSGLTLTQYMNQWNKTGKRPTKSSGTDDKPAKKSFRQRRADRLKARIDSDSGTEGQKRRQRRRLARVEKRMARNKADGGEIKAKGYYQGGSARLDESLGERQGSESTKSQSMKSRRNESRGATKKSTPKSAGAATRGWGAVMR